MSVNDNHIDWDKLLDIIEMCEANPESLNEEEISMLATARELRERLNMDKFSAEEGWESFVEKRDQKRRIRLRATKWLAAASVLFVAGLAIWKFAGKKESLKNTTVALVENIKLKRANGTVIVLGDSSKIIRDNDVYIKSNSSSITYMATAGQPQATAIFDTLEVPRGKTYSLKLPDGTLVSLNASSKLIFPENFTGAKREVYVEGETFFDVKHDPKHPFVVHAGGVSMTVLGTAFNVNTFDKAITTTLVRGKVLVTEGNDKVVLLPGEQSVYGENGTLYKQQVNDRLYTAWYRGDLFFDNATLVNIANTLGRAYDYNFVFGDASLEKIKLTLDMRKPVSMLSVLEQIEKTGSHIIFRVEGDKVYVEKKK